MPPDEEKVKNPIGITGVHSPDEVIRECPAGNEELRIAAKGQVRVSDKIVRRDMAST